MCVICGLAGIEAAHNERFWVQKLAKTATNVGSGTKIGVELRFRCPKRLGRQGLGRFRAIYAVSVHNLKFPVAVCFNFYTKGKVQGALGGIKIVIYARVPC